jgi:hypothetical protein
LASRAAEVILVERPRPGLLKTWKIRGREQRKTKNTEIKNREGKVRRDKAGN